MVFAAVGEGKIDHEFVFGEFDTELVLILDGVGYFDADLG